MGIQKMKETLKKENVDDYNRRERQAAVLKFEPIILNIELWSTGNSLTTASNKAILSRINKTDIVRYYTEVGKLEGFGSFSCGAASQRGYNRE